MPSHCINNYKKEIVIGENVIIDWNSLSIAELKSISVEASSLLGDFSAKYPVIDCLENSCSNSICLSDIAEMYRDIINCLNIASSKFTKRKVQRNKFKIIPGWNRRVKNFYKT